MTERTALANRLGAQVFLSLHMNSAADGKSGEGVETYMGMTINGFPNLYFMLGPNTALGDPPVGPLVRVFDVLTRQPLLRFFAFAKEFLGGIFVGGSS